MSSSSEELSAFAAAKVVGVGHKVLVRAHARGELPATVIGEPGTTGCRYQFKPADVEAFAEKRAAAVVNTRPPRSEDTKRKIGENQPNRLYEGKTRICALSDCYEEFWVRPYDVATGKNRLWCSKSCAMVWRRQHEPEKWVHDLYNLRRAALNDSEDFSLLTIAEIANRLGGSEVAVWGWITHGTLTAGKLVASKHERPGRVPVWVVEETEWVRFARANARNGDWRFKRWEDKEFVNDWRDARGLEAPRAAVRERVAKRRSEFAKRRRGRRPRSEPPAHHLEWRRDVNDLSEYYERQWRAGEITSLPTVWELCKEIAHERFAGDPNGTARIYMAVDRLPPATN